MTLVFRDKNSGTPLYTAELPEGFNGEAELIPVRFPANQTYRIRGTAAIPSGDFRLYFQTGENYNFSDGPSQLPPGSRNEEGGISCPPCTAADQMDRLASDFLGQNVSAVQVLDLTPQKAADVQKDAEPELQKYWQLANQVASFQSVPMALTIQQYVLDGGTGIYRAKTREGEGTLFVTIWRIGMQFNTNVTGMPFYGGMNPGYPGITMINWRIPLVIYLYTKAAANDSLLQLYNRFVETLQPTQELVSYEAAREQQQLQESLSVARMQAQKTQQEINYAWQQHEAGWARVDAMRQSISADLDAFHQGIHQQAREYDAMHEPGGAFYSSGASGAESMDDRIQRLRHESMMGVNTYTDADGREVEHSIMHDRVFQNDLDNNIRFGTENYYDDYVPDGWSELFRKK